MIVNPKSHTLLIWSLLVVLAVQGCAAPQTEGTNISPATLISGEIPTWTPRPIDMTQTAVPTATSPFPVSIVPTATRTKPVSTTIIQTPQTVMVTIDGGNLFVRRGPSLDYNYVGVLYDGETALATGRDRVSRWIRIALPSKPEVEGWITTETRYTLIDGDISNLTYIKTDPANPAFIRNCTKHELLIKPVGVKLLDKYNKPYNEERFSVGIYQIFDLENPDNSPIDEISLSEGKTVDILYDWTGEKSKCE